METSVFGRYHLIKPIGHGGMAAVYVAHQEGHQGFSKKVALKIVHGHLASQGQFTQYFINEARLGGYLLHPNIVQTLDFGEVDGRLFLAMEYIDGPTLQKILTDFRQRRQIIPLDVSLKIVSEVCNALDYAHRAVDHNNERLNMVHRDLKPSNIMVSRFGHVKLCDFGVARAESNLERTLTGGMIKGTLRYMSPEQAWGILDLDHRADLFAVGTVLYELLTMEPLYIAPTTERTLRMAQEAVVKDRLEALPDSPIRNELIEFLTRTLAKAVDDRFQTGGEMADKLNMLRDALPHRMALQKWMAVSSYGDGASGPARPSPDGSAPPKGMGQSSTVVLDVSSTPEPEKRPKSDPLPPPRDEMQARIRLSSLPDLVGLNDVDDAKTEQIRLPARPPRTSGTTQLSDPGPADDERASRVSGEDMDTVRGPVRLDPGDSRPAAHPPTPPPEKESLWGTPRVAATERIVLPSFDDWPAPEGLAETEQTPEKGRPPSSGDLEFGTGPEPEFAPRVWKPEDGSAWMEPEPVPTTERLEKLIPDKPESGRKASSGPDLRTTERISRKNLLDSKEVPLGPGPTKPTPSPTPVPAPQKLRDVHPGGRKWPTIVLSVILLTAVVLGGYWLLWGRSSASSRDQQEGLRQTPSEVPDTSSEDVVGQSAGEQAEKGESQAVPSPANEASAKTSPVATTPRTETGGPPKVSAQSGQTHPVRPAPTDAAPPKNAGTGSSAPQADNKAPGYRANVRQQGFLFANSKPASSVLLDGSPLESFPVMNQAISIGQHTLTFVENANSRLQIDIRIQSDQTLRCWADFNKEAVTCQ